MNKVVISRHDNEFVSISGDLTFSGIDKKTVRSFDFLDSGQAISIDLKAVGKTDSAGLALIVEWIKYANRHQKVLKFLNVPKQLMVLAKLSGLDQTEYFST